MLATTSPRERDNISLKNDVAAGEEGIKTVPLKHVSTYLHWLVEFYLT